jgi:hypothetical protein
MKQRRKWVVVAFFLVFVVLGLVYLGREKQKSARYHLRKLRQANAAYNAAILGKQSFRFENLKYWLGMRTPADDVREHEKALLEIGYFRQTDFTFSSTNDVTQFLRNTRGAAFSDTNWSLSIEGTNVSLIAATVDLELWRGIAVGSKGPAGISGSEL